MDLTVKDLKEFIKDLPDDLPVFVPSIDNTEYDFYKAHTVKRQSLINLDNELLLNNIYENLVCSIWCLCFWGEGKSSSRLLLEDFFILWLRILIKKVNASAFLFSGWKH